MRISGVSVEYLDRKLLKILFKKGWSCLREDFLEKFLEKYGISVKEWEYSTKCFYLARTEKIGDKEIRIWEPVKRPEILMILD